MNRNLGDLFYHRRKLLTGEGIAAQVAKHSKEVAEVK